VNKAIVLHSTLKPQDVNSSGEEQLLVAGIPFFGPCHNVPAPYVG